MEKTRLSTNGAFIHIEGIEDTSGIDADGSYTESKYNKKEAEKVVS